MSTCQPTSLHHHVTRLRHCTLHYALRSLLLLLISISPAMAPHTFAQDNGAQSSTEDDTVTMNMRDADIRALIQWVADKTQKNMIVHKAVEGKVTVLSSQPISTDQAYQVFLSVLQVHGYAAVETDGAVRIVPVALASSSALPASSSSSSADMVVSVIKVSNVSATKIADTLRPLLSKEAVITAYADTNSLVIADHASNIQSARELVAKLDNGGDNRIELIRLQHADATEVLDSLSALIPSASGNQFELTMSVDTRSNSLLVAGDPAKRKQVRDLVRRLDTPLEGQGNTQVVYLHYVDAKELVPILKSLAESIQSNQKDATKISIESSESSNALVMNAPPAMLNTMKRVISQLDIRRAQVLVEAVVVEVSGTIASDIGVTWVTDPEKELIAGINTLGDLPLTSITGGDSDSDIGDSVDITSVGRGFTFGYFNNGDLQAAIRALDANQNANILSTPTVVAIDNEEASLLVGQNVPFITGQSTSSASSTNDPFTTIERQDIGITLVVTPRINEGDSITLEIQQKTENLERSVETAAVAASDIITSKREIITKALIKDDQILVLGGLISDEETEIQEKVPFLGDLPLVGKLFSSTGKSKTKQNLMVFIHPVILKDDEHMRTITQKRYNFMKDLRERSLKKEWRIDTEQSNSMEEFDTITPQDAIVPEPQALN